MGGGGEPADDGHTFVVTLPGVDLPLGDETFGRRFSGLEVGANILGRMEERSSLVVFCVFDVELRLFFQRYFILYLASFLLLSQVLCT